MVENPPAVQETWVQSLGWEDPLERGWLPAPEFLPGEFHGQRSLAGYTWYVGSKESDMTERRTLTKCLLVSATKNFNRLLSERCTNYSYVYMAVSLSLNDDR